MTQNIKEEYFEIKDNYITEVENLIKQNNIPMWKSDEIATRLESITELSNYLNKKSIDIVSVCLDDDSDIQVGTMVSDEVYGVGGIAVQLHDGLEGYETDIKTYNSIAHVFNEYEDVLLENCFTSNHKESLEKLIKFMTNSDLPLHKNKHDFYTVQIDEREKLKYDVKGREIHKVEDDLVNTTTDQIHLDENIFEEDSILFIIDNASSIKKLIMKADRRTWVKLDELKRAKLYIDSNFNETLLVSKL